MSEDRYTRTHFAPAEVSYGAVTITDGAGNVLRTVSRETLRARALETAKLVESALKLLDGPPRKPRGRALTFTGRKKKGAE